MADGHNNTSTMALRGIVKVALLGAGYGLGVSAGVVWYKTEHPEVFEGV